MHRVFRALPAEQRFYRAQRQQRRCAQPCRWEYHLYEKGYDDEYFPAYADERGTYVFNSKDLCMIAYLDDMIKAGITSLKIEGRMKSAYYGVYHACVQTGAQRLRGRQAF